MVAMIKTGRWFESFLMKKEAVHSILSSPSLFLNTSGIIIPPSLPSLYMGMIRSQKLTHASSVSSSKNRKSVISAIVSPIIFKNVRLHFNISPDLLKTQQGVVEWAMTCSLSRSKVNKKASLRLYPSGPICSIIDLHFGVKVQTASRILWVLEIENCFLW